jgi:hypothetical protein
METAGSRRPEVPHRRKKLESAYRFAFAVYGAKWPPAEGTMQRYREFFAESPHRAAGTKWNLVGEITALFATGENP